MKKNLIRILVATMLLCVAASAQSPSGTVEHLSKDVLSFDYPSGWSVVDKSNEQLLHVILTRADNSALIIIIVQREPLQTSKQFYDARNAVTLPFVENLAHQLGLNKAPEESDAQCLSVNWQVASGFLMKGQLKGEPATGEVYTVALGQRLTHLVYVRNDKDDATGSPAWKKVTETIKVQSPSIISPEAGLIEMAIMSGVLTGKVAKKYTPDYPSYAKYARVEGKVIVQITVNESGDVIRAGAIDGPEILRPTAVEAVRKWKFRPTLLCGHPVKVTGTVTVNFTL